MSLSVISVLIILSMIVKSFAGYMKIKGLNETIADKILLLLVVLSA